jgi:hypothetical protein
MHVSRTSIIKPLGTIRTFAYDPDTLKPLKAIDENCVTTSYSYNIGPGHPDPLDRLCAVARATGTRIESWRQYTYSSPASPLLVTVKQDQTVTDDNAGVRVDTLYDGLGRQSETPSV